MTLPLGVNISTVFGELAFLDRIDAAQQAGFVAAECQFPYAFPAEEIAARLARAGMPMVLINTPPGDLAKGELGLAALPGREDEFRASVEQAIAYAKVLGVPAVHVMAGSGETSRELFAMNLAWAAARLAEADLVALIEPLNAIDRPDYLLTRIDDAMDLIARIGAPNLKLQLDLYHWRKSGGSDFAELAALLPLVGHVQLAAVPDRGEPGPDDFALLERLEAAGWRGVIGCEYVPRGSSVEGLVWMDGLKRAA